MLVLKRRIGEKVIISGTGEVILSILGIQSGQVKFGFEAPPTVKIDREEVALRKKAMSS